LNKIDRAGSRCGEVLAQLGRELPGTRFLPIQAVTGEGDGTAAVSGFAWEEEALREDLLLALSDCDPEMEEAFLSEELPSPDRLFESLRRLCAGRQVTPVLFGSAKL